MGSIFKPSTTVVQAPQQQTVTQQIPEYFKEIQERTLRRAEDLGNRPYQAFTGQRIAPVSALEQAAANVFEQQILPGAANLGAIGAQTFDVQAAQDYMNPYTNTVIQSTLADLGEQFGQQERNLASRAIGAGAFGGTRFGVESALGRERYLDQVADVSSRLRQAGFESGAQRFARDRAAQLQAQQAQLASLSGAAAGLTAAGGLERGIQQAGLAEAYRDFIEEREYPVEQVRQVVGALAGAPIRTYGEERSGFVGTPVAGPSAFGQIAGAAGAVAPFFSDIRLKDDIQLVGKSRSGINIYNFRYKGDNKKYQGVMAHQVPQASEVHTNGYLYVDYSKIDVDFKEI
ncbi:hypothetical protein [Phenylobacterium sp.]|jgi:hypothetical protein|uniref:hypothetical protein n=1 Tax=Phenylobacterium sp. TaxID=1871053 RepID=UPI0025E2CFE5|nr:hypothetical protein [Phenylobacterium sp.]